MRAEKQRWVVAGAMVVALGRPGPGGEGVERLGGEHGGPSMCAPVSS
jgi:hypothetical protein